MNDAGVVGKSLNMASAGIQKGISMVGFVSEGIIGGVGAGANYAISGLGNVVDRMTSLGCQSNKSTPIESYVGMVTKENPRSATIA